MLSRTAKTCVPGGELLAKSTELKCIDRQSCPPSGSADRFSETANLMVNMGVRLQTKWL